jgi:hypothetical protein
VERKERGTCTSRPTAETPETPRPELTRTFDSLCLPSKEGGRGDKETEEDEEDKEQTKKKQTKKGQQRTTKRGTKKARTREQKSGALQCPELRRQASKHTQ